MIPEKERMRLPMPPPAARRPGLPVIAILAPLVMAGALWVITSSPFALLVAFLGPVVAVAGWLDGRRTLRRDRRSSVVHVRRQLHELASRIESRSEQHRLSLERAAPRSSILGSDPAIEGRLVIRLGTGDVPSGIEFDPDAASDVALELAREIDLLRERAAHIRDAPVVVDGGSDVVATGPAVLVRAFARALTVQAIAACPVEDALVLLPAEETWTRMLPHAVGVSNHWEVRSGDRRLIRVRHVQAAARFEGVLVHLGDDSGSPSRVDEPHRIEPFRPWLVCSAEATARAREIAVRARAGGWRPESETPATVSLASLEPHDSTEALTAAVGMDPDGPVHLDLDRDGPHALVAGTTGSGKSELLVTWVLALARACPPSELGFLLIDFKGGAAFAPLRHLPHVVGMVSDLDSAAASRAVESLRAELRRREEQLARHGARSIAEMPPGSLARLVIVVDEFAALVSLDAELQGVFADLAARGRSLGLHLIVCTQRPSGIIRESVLANVTLRICLRVLDAADSTAVVGHPGAAALSTDARGRGVLADGRRARTVQFALSDADDAEAIRRRWAGHPRAEGRPWLDPLPARLSVGELGTWFPSTANPGVALIGAIDLPELQRRGPLAVDPWGAGALLVLGATGSGRSTALDTIGDAVDADVRRVGDDPADVWQALSTPAGERRVLVILDDLDRTLAIADTEQRADLGELLAKVARGTGRSGLAIAASARSAGGAMHALHSAFEQRIILRTASREEHLLAGGQLGGFRSDRGPGSCVWQDSEAQIALPPAGTRELWRAPLPQLDLGTEPWSVVTPRPRDLIARLTDAGVSAGAPSGSESSGRTLVADVDGWLIEHSALALARREGRLLLLGCTAADHRTLTRMRGALPPLSGEDEAWLFDGATTSRVRVGVP
jgi:S-DNA-T family DNA segregation ATPase FtsK/SpoIIIE